ncbi:MAG: 4-hydroxy-3-methylbut-2-enyl diphosphate reductase [Planctomycetaceae bacterium]|jgi:4-hydroxy-3-methylbut-2-enyl diphosphate reductase|nr:4-hydroxy-3-methylbut-2-enyl diphosphate reductase [Planctomycetaceae bacterium]
MKIILAKPRGFCAGVNMAISTLDEALKRFGKPVYVYHDIVHNTWVVDEFRDRGVIFVERLEDVPDGATLLFSAHGVSPIIREAANKRGLRTIDATCPLVNKVHRAARQFAADGYTTILVGNKSHDEVAGIIGEAPDSIIVVENISQIHKLKIKKGSRLAFMTQTTISKYDTNIFIDALQKRFPDIVITPDSSICFATQNRQEAVSKLAAMADVVVVIGSNKSSNSRRLADIAESSNVCAYLVDGPDDIRGGWFKGDETVLITAGASAPEHIVQECIEVLIKRFHTTVEEHIVCEENIKFTLPKELRENY